MAQYKRRLSLRILGTMVDVIRDYPEVFAGRQSWPERVYYRDPAEPQPVPISSIWKNGGPKVVKHFVAAMKLAQWLTDWSGTRVSLDDSRVVDQEAVI
jgi:hypothetical protein